MKLVFRVALELPVRFGLLACSQRAKFAATAFVGDVTWSEQLGSHKSAFPGSTNLPPHFELRSRRRRSQLLYKQPQDPRKNERIMSHLQGLKRVVINN